MLNKIISLCDQVDHFGDVVKKIRNKTKKYSAVVSLRYNVEVCADDKRDAIKKIKEEMPAPYDDYGRFIGIENSLKIVKICVQE